MNKDSLSLTVYQAIASGLRCYESHHQIPVKCIFIFGINRLNRFVLPTCSLNVRTVSKDIYHGHEKTVLPVRKRHN